MRTGHSVVFDVAAGDMLALRREVAELVPDLVGRSYADIRAEYGVQGRNGTPELRVQDGVAIIDIAGPITRTDNICTAFFGGTSVEGIRTQLRQALASTDVQSILFYVDSPGGSVNGLADLADEMYTARKQKPTFAYVDDLGASAAYWLATAAGHLTVSQSGYVGSIGVYSVYTDTSKADAQNGVRRIKIVSTGSPNKALTPDSKAGFEQYQAHMDETLGLFVSAVARGRGVTTETVLEQFGQGDVVFAPEAVSRGMADAVGTIEQALARARERGVRGGGMRAELVAPERDCGLLPNSAMGEEPVLISAAVASHSNMPVGPANDTREEHIMENGQQPVQTPAAEVQAPHVQASQPVVQTPAAAVAVQPAPVADNGAQIERTRVAEITSLCQAFGMNPLPHIQSGVSVDAVRKAILDGQISAQAPLAASAEGRASVGEENVDKFREAAADALLLRAGVNIGLAKRGGGYTPAAGAEQLASMSLRDMMIDYQRLRGKSDAHRLSTEDLVRAAVLTPDSQFSGMLDNTVGKAMMIGYAEAATTFQLWTARGSNPDFKATKRYRLSEAGVLEKLPQNGEIKHDEMQDEGVSTLLDTYAKRFSLNRQAIINDDLAYLTRIPGAYTQAALRGLNRAVYAFLNLNPTIYDSIALFDANTHANYKASGGAAPGTTTLATARTAMRRQKKLRGDAYINVTPAFLIAPPELETTVDVLLFSTGDPASSNANVVNPFRGKLQAITDSELTDAYKWFLAAAPGSTDTIEVTYLSGRDMPTLESQVSWENLGMEWRIYFDWAVTVLDYRGLYCNVGH